MDHTWPKIIVVSHERSGTHFLMDALAGAFGYQSRPWIDFAPEQLKLNFYYARDINQFFRRFAQEASPPIAKSHHAYGFFAEAMATMPETIRIVYMYRDAQAVMKSLRRFLICLPWREGPHVARDSAFIRTPPGGQMLRYQMHQRPSMIARWGEHVADWLDAARDDPRIIPVRYDALDRFYEQTLFEISDRLGIPVTGTARPDRSVSSAFTLPENHEHHDGGGFDADDEAYIEEHAARAMAYLRNEKAER